MSLSAERNALSFNPLTLRSFLHQSPEIYFSIQKIQDEVWKNPILTHDPDIFSESRLSKIRLYIQKFHEYYRLNEYNSVPAQLASWAVFSHPFLCGVHQSMFVPCLENLASDEQLAKWMPLTKSFKMIGCYAQTELGHGSDIQNLETIAELDVKTDEFILHSPTLTSIKFWPGDLGIFANHAMVFAQLVINGVNYGLQAFLVQIRDFETHEPMQSVEVGDIGPKYGYATKDNGYLRLDKVRIPRTNLLMKYVNVNREGEFKKIGNDKTLYGIMMKIRTIISCDSVSILTQGLTIAVRYSIGRTQFKNKIMDYILQMDKLIPIVAQAFAIVAAGNKTRSLVTDNITLIKINDFSKLNETHIALASTKAYNSSTILLGLEKCRLACGGHGYSHYSGLPNMIQEYAPNCTYEGENTVMYLQVARYLLKHLEKASRNRELPHDVQYLQRSRIFDQEIKPLEFSQVTIKILHEIITLQAIYCIRDAASGMMEAVTAGNSLKESWDKKNGIKLVEAARNHTVYYTFDAFAESLSTLKISKTNQHINENTHFLPIDQPCFNILEKLCLLYGICSILEKPLFVLEAGILLPQQIDILLEEKEKLMKVIRPDVIGLVDCFQWNDNSLRSCLGRFDGNIYENLFELAANGNKMNKKEVADGIEYLKKMKEIDAKL